jgi:CspA family cold shock protein
VSYLVLRCAECATQFVWAAGEQTAQVRPALCPACQKLAPAPGRQRGVVKWYSRGKGYGFITPIQGADVFVHKSGLAAEATGLRAGQLVEFSVSHAARGAQAEAVTVLEVTEAPA